MPDALTRPASSTRTPTTPGRRLAAAALLSVAYLGAALASLQLEALGRGVTPLWLPSGIALAGLLLLGLGAWPAVAVPAMVAASIGADAGPGPGAPGDPP